MSQSEKQGRGQSRSRSYEAHRAVAELTDRFRSPYQVDKERIIFSKAFRRLKHKTQVLHSPKSDHFRTRLTHTLEVAQISYTLAKALGLNVELAEAIAFGHDIGHTPFGHAGERALNDCLTGFDSHFCHNEQGKKVVRELARLVPDGPPGMNLTEEVIDGILAHPRDWPDPQTDEGWLVRYADFIAYVNHDYEDLLTAHMHINGDLRGSLQEIGGTRLERINVAIEDISNNNEATGQVRMSHEMNKLWVDAEEIFELYFKMPEIREKDEAAHALITRIFVYLHDKVPESRLSSFLGPENMTRLRVGGVPKYEVIADHIAGMTDTYALDRYYDDLLAPKVAYSF